MSRSRVKTHFQYGWWIYLIIIAAVIIFWCTVFSRLAEPDSDEMLNITIVGDADDEALSADLAEALEGKTAKPLKEINIEIVSGDDAALSDIVTMRCLGETDFIIFEEEYIIRPVSSNFGPVDEDGWRTYFPDAQLYEEEGAIYGMLLYDGQTECNFTDYYSGDQRCWVFVTPVSENAAALNGKGEAQDDAALQAIQYLMEE